MRCWQVKRPGAAPVIARAEVPEPGPGAVRLRVAAVGLNFADLLMLAGHYQTRPPLPFVPGMECAGVVEASGPGSGGPRPGTRVLAVVGHGALAERLCLPAARLTAIPDRMDFAEAAGFAIAHGTAHLALTRKARLGPGETLLVTGAAGGVGLTAVEIGKRLGARVIASARGADRLAEARAAGADVLIDSDAPDLTGRLRAEGGLDVVFDTVGGPAFDAALRACRPEGRLLAIGFASGAVPQFRPTSCWSGTSRWRASGMAAIWTTPPMPWRQAWPRCCAGGPRAACAPGRPLCCPSRRCPKL